MVYGDFMRKIIAIPNTRLVPKDYLSDLKTFQDNVKKGDIISYAIVGIGRQGMIHSGHWAESTVPLLGGIEYLKSRVLAKMSE